MIFGFCAILTSKNMLERLLSAIVVGIGLASSAASEPDLRIGNATIIPPAGWQLVKKTEEKLVLRAADGKQQATITLMRLEADPTSEQFEQICKHRYEAEKRDAPDITIEPSPPHPSRDGATFFMIYSGSEKRNGRVFSGYLSLANRELITIYVEGISVTAKVHSDAFQAFVGGLKRK